MAWPLEPTTDLVMMLHLRPSGREEIVQARLGLYFSEAPPTRLPTLVRLTRQDLDIPPGESRYVATDSYRLPVDADVYTVQPHAHYLARAVDGFATLPDGSRRWLISIRDWDFNWQGVFRYRRPIPLPAGSTVTMKFVYDNSAANRANPSHPPRRVTYGQRTSDEMSELWLQVVARTPADRDTLAGSVRAKVLREEIVGHEKMLEAERDNRALHDDTALLYVQAGDLAHAAAHFAESLRIRPDAPEASYNLGSALLMLGRSDEARGYFRKAIALNPNYGLALTQLAWMLATSPNDRIRQPAEALQLAERAAELAQPPSARTLDVLAAALAAAGHYDRAVTTANAALALAGGDDQLQRNIRGRILLYREHRAFIEP
jgi:Flp pilus assembly protein TadD